MSHRHENRADFDLCESAPSPSAIDPEALTVSAAVTIIYQIMD